MFIDDVPPFSDISIGNPFYGGSPINITSTTEFEIISDDEHSGIANIWYNIDRSGWNQYIGNFTLSGKGYHNIEYYAEDNVGNTEKYKDISVYLDDEPPTSILAIGNPNYEISPIYVTIATEFEISDSKDWSSKVFIAK